MKDDELRQEIRNSFATSWQDGYGCAKYPNYKERTDMHTDRVMKLIKQYGIQERANELAGILSRNMSNGDAVRTNANMTRVMTVNERYIDLTALKEISDDKS